MTTRKSNVKKITSVALASTLLIGLAPPFMLDSVEAAADPSTVAWSKKPSVTVTLTPGTDALSGIASTKYKLTGVTTKAETVYSAPFALTAEGVTTVTATSTDKAANISDVTTKVVGIDRTLPIMPALAKDHSTEWTNKATSVVTSGTGTDPLGSGADVASGVTSYESRTNGGSWVASTAGKTFNVTEDGTTTVEVVAIDRAGNRSVASSQTVKRDTVVPNTGAYFSKEDSSVYDESVWYTEDQKLKLTEGADELSGVDHYEVTYPNKTVNKTLVAGNIVTTDQEGTLAYDVATFDKAGNKISRSFNVRVDKTIPAKPTLAPSALEYTKDSILVTITDNGDAVSGVKEIQYNTNGGEWTKYDAPVEISNEGTTTINSRVIDNAGLISETATAYAKIDKTGPGVPALVVDPTEWTAGSATVTLTDGVDAIVGTDYSEIKIGDGEWTRYTKPVTVELDGITIIKGRSTDTLGNVGEETSVISKVDNVKPLDPSVLASATGWTKDDVTISSIDGIDLHSGVDQTKWSKDRMIWNRYSDLVTISEEGQTPVHFKTIDRVGNESNEVTVTAKVDKSGPIAPDVVVSDEAWTKGPVDLEVTRTDDAYSGVAKTEYKIGEGDWAEYVGVVNVTKEGVQTLEFRSTDNVGNLGAVTSKEIKIDKTGLPAPTVVSNPSTWSNKDAVVTVTGVEDGTSPVAKLEVKINDGTWETYTGEVTVNTNGQTEVFARSIDSAGNVGQEASVITYVDKIAPAVTSVDVSNNSWSSEAVVVTALTGSDALSGFKQTEYSFDKSDWKVYDKALSISDEGQSKVYFRDLDNAGNYSEILPVEIKVDTAGPSAPLFVLNPSGWTNQIIMAELINAGEDVTSGIARTEYKVGNGEWTTYTVAVAISLEGTTDIQFRSIDLAGNIGEVMTLSAKRDTVAPTKPEIILSSLNWINGDGTFRLTSSADTNSFQYEYSVDDAEYTQGDNGVVSETGTHVIKARAVDHVGNISEVVEGRLLIDKQSPTVTMTEVPNVWHDGPVDVSVSGTDAHSGMASIHTEIVTDASMPPNTWRELKDGKTTVSDEGIHYVYAKLTDKVANTLYAASGEVKIQHQPQAVVATASDATANSVRVSWNLPEAGVYTDSYSYIVTNTTTGESKTVDYPSSSVVMGNLVAGQVNNFKVTVKNHVGEAESLVDALTLPPAPANVRMDKIDENFGSSYLYVAAVDNAIAYHIIVSDDADNKLVDEVITETSYLVEGLQAGTYYNVKASAINDSGEGASIASRYLSLPAEPNGFNVVQVFTNKVLLGWNQVDTATRFHLDRNGAEIFNGMAQSHEDLGLQSGTEYNYALSAENETGEGTKTRLDGIVTIPSEVDTVEISDVSSAGFKASWDTVRGATGYKVTVSDGQVFDTASTEQVVTGLATGTEYTVTVIPYNGNGDGGGTVGTLITIPDVPVNLKTIESNETTVSVAWDVVKGAESYEVVSGDKSYEVSSNTAIITDLDGSHTYTWSVKAKNVSGESAESLGDFITLPKAVSELKVTDATVDSMTASWAAEPLATGYKVTANGKTETVVGTTFTATELNAGTNYTFSVVAINPAGEGRSGETSASTLTKGIDTTSIKVKPEITSATINWSAVEGAESYAIYSDSGAVLYNGSELEAEVVGLTSGAVKSAYIVSYNAEGLGSAKTTFNFLTKPGQPTLSVKTQKVGKIVLNLDSNGNIVTGYKVYKNGKLLSELTQVATLVLDSEAGPNETNVYSVVPENTTGIGEATSINASTPSEAVGDVSVIGRETDAEVTFDPVDGANNYILKDSIGNIVWQGTEGPVLINGLELGNDYKFTLETVNNLGLVSEPKEFVVVTLPKIPQGIKHTVGKDTVTLEFAEAITKNVDAFIIERDNKEIGKVTVGTETWTEKDLKPGSYDYVISAVNTSGKGESLTLTAKIEEEVKEPVASTGGGGGGTVSIPEVKPEPEVEKEPEAEVEVEPEIENRFVDTETVFSRKEINALADRGIVKGTSENVFEPQRPITRIEFASLVVRTLNAEAGENIKLPFRDIKTNAWYDKELRAAISNGIASGFSEKEFRPNDLINREQATKMLANVVLKQGIPRGDKIFTFTDAQEIVGWAREDVVIATGVGLIEGYPDGTFGPKRNLTRAESAALIYRLLGMVE